MHQDLASIELILRPYKTNRVPYWLGRAAQALFFHTLRDIHAGISAYLHDEVPLKPFTASNLLDTLQNRDLMEIHPDQRLRLRYTSLHPHMTSLLWNGLVPLWCTGISLHDQRFRVLAVRSSRRRSISYAEILETASSEYERLTLRFTSPTAFKRTGGGIVAKPDAGLIFGSLLQRWNAFSPHPLPRNYRELFAEQIAVERETFNREYIRGKKHHEISGFTGTLHFRPLHMDADARRALYALARFAPFSGVGIKTTIGMGQIVHHVNSCESSSRLGTIP